MLSRSLEKVPLSAVTVCGSDPVALRSVHVTDSPTPTVIVPGVYWNENDPVLTMVTEAAIAIPGARMPRQKIEMINRSARVMTGDQSPCWRCSGPRSGL